MHVFPHAVIENLNQIFAQANKRILHKIQSRRDPKVISSKKLLKAWVSSAKYYNECHLWQGANYFLRQHFQSTPDLLIKLLVGTEAFPMALSSY